MELQAKKLVRACTTRWLSHEKAVKAMKEEIVLVWAALEYFAKEKKDATAIGVLKFTQDKHFLCCLYLLNTVLPHLNSLSLIFQDGRLHFAHITPALETCKQAIERIALGDEAVETLKSEEVDGE